MGLASAVTGFGVELAARRENPEGQSGLPTGFPDLDAKIGGLAPGEVVVIGSRTSMGKTAVILEIVRSVCEHLLETGDPRLVAFISAELDGPRLVQRWVSSHLNIPRSKLPFTPAEPMNAYLEHMRTWPLEIFDARAPSLEQVKTVLEEWSGNWSKDSGTSSPLALIVVDHIGKLRVVEGGREVHDIYPRTSKIADELYNLAGQYGCPVVEAAQVNRGVEGRVSKDREGNVDFTLTRPLPSDLEGSGKVEQNCDAAVMLWREEHYRAMFEGREETTADLEMNVAKSRGGATGVVKYPFVPELTKILVPTKGPKPKVASKAEIAKALKDAA